MYFTSYHLKSIYFYLSKHLYYKKCMFIVTTTCKWDMRNWKGEKKEMINRGVIERMKLRIEGRGEKRSDRKNEGQWQSEDTSM